MTDKEKILKKLLEEKAITFEEMLILQQKEIEIQYPQIFQPYINTPYLGPDWTYRPDQGPQWKITCNDTCNNQKNS